MKRAWLGLGLVGLATVAAFGIGANEARAQAPGESVVYETVAPGYDTVTYGERYKVRYRPRRTVIKERPYAYVTRTPAVVRETRYIQPAPVVESYVVQPPPVVESRVVQPPPIVERRVIQPAPTVETRYRANYPY